jgi:hypothetical protein
MASRADTYRVRAAEYDRQAETLGHGNAAVRAYYQRLAQHWRSLALLSEVEAEHDPPQRPVPAAKQAPE